MSETIRMGHLQIESPWGNAGGVVKHLEDVETMARTGVGWIEAGSYTLEPRVGNSPNGEKVYVYDAETGTTYNSLGMPNRGMDIVEKEIPEMIEIAHAHNKPLIVNVAPVTNDPAMEARELVTRAYEAGADAVLVNGGCPNVVTEDGGRKEILSRNSAKLYETLSTLSPVVAKYQRVFVRVSPAKSPTDAAHVAQAIDWSRSASVVFTPNTWPGEKPPAHLDQLEVEGGVGGKSGPATSEDAYDQTIWFAHHSSYDVVSSGGIMNGAELDRRIGRSALNGVVAGAGTTFFYESGDWRHDVDRLLREFSEA